MDYGYSAGYRGQAVSPLPAGYLEAATEPGRNIARGIENAGAGVGKFIENWKAKQQQDKQKLALVKALAGSEETVKALGYQSKDAMLNDSSDNVLGATKALVFHQGIREAQDAAKAREQQLIEGKQRVEAEKARVAEQIRQREALAKFQGMVAQGSGPIAEGIRSVLRIAGMPMKEPTLDPAVLTRYAAQAGVLTAPQALDAAAQAATAENARLRAKTDAVQAQAYNEQVRLSRERAGREPKIVTQDGTKLLVQPSGQADVLPERPAGVQEFRLPDDTVIKKNLTLDEVNALIASKGMPVPKFKDEKDQADWKEARDAIAKYPDSPKVRERIIEARKKRGYDTTGL